MTKAVRVIGIGSPVSGDEVGMRLVERLRDDPQWQRHRDIEWLLLERPGVALLHYFAGVQNVVLVDALEGAGEDTVVRLDPCELMQTVGACSTHHFGVAEALRLAETLGQLPPRLLIFGVGTGETQRLDGAYRRLSEQLAAGLAP